MLQRPTCSNLDTMPQSWVRREAEICLAGSRRLCDQGGGRGPFEKPVVDATAVVKSRPEVHLTKGVEPGLVYGAVRRALWNRLHCAASDTYPRFGYQHCPALKALCSCAADVCDVKKTIDNPVLFAERFQREIGV